MLTLDDFNYDLPSELIAQKPIAPRDHSRLLFFKRQQQTWSHHYFYDLPQILTQGQEKFVFVRNNSKVIPARLHGVKKTGGQVEIFLWQNLASNQNSQIWECLTKPGLKNNHLVFFPPSQVVAQCLNYQGEYTRQIKFIATPKQFQQLIKQYGQTPLPPYIKSRLDENKLRQVYQTIYAQKTGSVAAPTAGLHFTAELTQKLKEQGHEFIDLTLHVGLGTFLSVKCQNITQHHMHQEQYFLNASEAQKLHSALIKRKKIIAIGTTSTRVLETLARSVSSSLLKKAQAGQTSIFLYPPAQFHFTSGLITNFHLPKSTLLMLVSAFTHQPNTQFKFKTWSTSALGQAYQDAIKQKYRFFSFGDAMLIL